LPERVNKGLADDFPAAKAAFKENWEKLVAADRVLAGNYKLALSAHVGSIRRPCGQGSPGAPPFTGPSGLEIPAAVRPSDFGSTSVYRWDPTALFAATACMRARATRLAVLSGVAS
jgi:hypothetical protein